MSQTSYSVNLAAAQAGQPYDAGLRDVLSFITLADNIPFGVVVARNSTDDNNCKLPAASTDDLLGVAMLSQTKEQALNTGVVQYVAGDAVPVLRRGRIWVVSEQAVTPADSVFVRYASGAGGSQKGSIRKDADTSTAVAFAKCRFLNNSVSGLVLLEISM